MFASRDEWMVVKAAKLSVVEDDKKVEHRMAEVQLVIEDLPRALASEMGEDVAGHLFTDGGAVRHELASITLDPRVQNQRISVRQVVDGPATEIHDVEVLSLTCARQEDEKTGKEWIRATARVRFDLAPRIHREWLSMHFGYGLHFSFDAEQLDMLDDARSAAKRLGDMGGGTLTDDKGNVILDIPSTACRICGGPDATETTKALSGLPKGVLACDECRAAVKRREVGVVRNRDGILHITDARKAAEPVNEAPAADQASA